MGGAQYVFVGKLIPQAALRDAVPTGELET